MTRHLRGAWARRRVLLPLLLLTTTVVAGAVTVVGFAGAADTSGQLVVPLLLLGAVAVPATARELAAARRGEIALARLRGLERGELQSLLAVEPLLALLVGGLLGIGAGAAGAWLAGRTWVDAGAAPVGVPAVLAGLGIVAVALVAVAVGTAAALREPLSQQVSVTARPRRGSVLATFGSVLVLVAAVVAVYRARQPGSDDPDWVVLAGPALVGLAAGQLVVWLVRLLARLGVRRTGTRALPVFLAMRRLARLPDAADALRVLVGAAVVAALALSGAVQVDDWADDAARLRVGAPLQVPVEGQTALGVVGLTHDLDPDGRWLMAAVLVPGPGGPAARRVFLDTARYDAVVGGFLDDTDAAPLADRVDELAVAAPTRATGDRVTATVAGVSARRSGSLRPMVVIGYRNAAGVEREVRLTAELGRDGSPVEQSGDLSGCGDGCEVTRIDLARNLGSRPLPWVLTGLDLGGVDALVGPWLDEPGSATVVDNGLLVPAGETVRAQPLPTSTAVPVLTTDSVDADERGTVASPGGDERETDLLDVVPTLPLVGSDGMLADLPTTAAGAPPTVPAAEVLVLARADTPDDVLAGLTAAGGGDPLTLDAAADRVQAESGAAQARVYALMAGFCLVVALLVLLTATARQRDGWRRDVAALRVSGLDPAAVGRSGRVEVLVLALAAGAATLAGAVLAIRLLLDELALVTAPEHVVPLRAGLVLLPLLLVTAAAVVATLLVVGRGRTVGDASRPAILREEAQR